MNDSFLDAHEITIDCPKCGHQLTEKLGRLKHDPRIPCPGCGTTIAIEASGLNNALGEVDQSLADLRKALGSASNLGRKF